MAKLAEENETLKARIQELEQKARQLAILVEDRKFLTSDNERLKAENDKYSSENKELKDALEKSHVASDSMRMELEKLRKNHLNTALSFRSIGDSSPADKEFQQKYNLPGGEFPITYYSCSNSSYHTGYLYISPHYLIWDPSASLFGEKYFTIELKTIKSLNKVKALAFLPIKGASVEVKVLRTDPKDKKEKEDTITLRAFLSRKEAVASIVKTAKNAGHVVHILRDGQLDTSVGSLS
eukprot:TRINITY_DN2779_c0_g1_i2.p1 TRINITY_DN2779_c0_g1~~TRINITY_DN2779_c0_g1_i2.p1  ORF type:complete len:238 (+),score=59.88 TRINITY_DN2779_c0_g1_i2:64-777(+)